MPPAQASPRDASSSSSSAPSSSMDATLDEEEPGPAQPAREANGIIFCYNKTSGTIHMGGPAPGPGGTFALSSEGEAVQPMCNSRVLHEGWEVRKTFPAEATACRRSRCWAWMSRLTDADANA